MSVRPWRQISASVAGAAHLREGSPCQDACAVLTREGADGPWLLCAMADGAGTAVEGGQGARLACDLLVKAMSDAVAGGSPLAALDRDGVEAWLDQFHDAVGALAEAAALTPRDFACTLLGALIGPERGVFFQIGDGAMVIPRHGDAEGYEWVFWPAAGEFANETWFATAPDAADHLEWALVKGPIDAFAAFTDGLQHLVLHYESRSAHDPFFRQMFRFLEAAEPEAPLLAPLEEFLASPAVNERTDDDKSLILASRRGDP